MAVQRQLVQRREELRQPEAPLALQREVPPEPGEQLRLRQEELRQEELGQEVPQAVPTLLRLVGSFSVSLKEEASLRAPQSFRWRLPGRELQPSSQEQFAPEGGCLFPWWVCFRYRLPNFPHSAASNGRERQRLSVFTNVFYAVRLL